MSIAPRTIAGEAAGAPLSLTGDRMERDLSGIPRRNAAVRIGIDIGYRIVKCVVAHIAGKKVTPVWVRGFERPRNKEVTQILAEEIAFLTQKLSPKKIEVVVGLESEFANIRYVKFANVPSSEFAQAASIEASSHIFLSEEDLQIDVTRYRAPDKASKAASHGAVSAIQTSEVQKRLRALQDAGIKDGGVVLTSVALVAGCLQMSITSPERVHAIIDIGARSGKIIIHRGHEIYLVRDFLTELHRREADWKVDLSYLQAEGAAAKDDASPSMFSAELSVDSITNEILMSASFFSREYGYDIDHATVIGGEAGLDGLVEALQKKINVPLAELSQRPPSPIADKAKRNSALRKNLPIIFPALCLALVDAEKLDFGRFPLKMKLLGDIRLSTFSWQRLAIFFAFLYALLFVSTTGLRRNAGRLQHSCELLLDKKGRLAESLSLWEFELEKQKKKNKPPAEGLPDELSYRADLLRFMAKTCSPDVWLTNFSSREAKELDNKPGQEQNDRFARREEIQASGYAATPGAADRFAQQLLQTAFFDKLAIAHLKISRPDSLAQHVRFAVSLVGEKHASAP